MRSDLLILQLYPLGEASPSGYNCKMSKSDRIDVYLVAGGKYHNIDYARLEILKLLAEQSRIKVQVGGDYSDITAICDSDFLITYTCDVIPSESETKRLIEFVASGKKWFALHGTNSILRFLELKKAQYRVSTMQGKPFFAAGYELDQAFCL